MAFLEFRESLSIIMIIINLISNYELIHLFYAFFDSNVAFLEKKISSYNPEENAFASATIWSTFDI